MENSSNVQGLKLQDKYLLTSKETGAYFNNGKLLFFRLWMVQKAGVYDDNRGSKRLIYKI